MRLSLNRFVKSHVFFSGCLVGSFLLAQTAGSNEIARIIMAEGGSLRGAPTSTVPSGTVPPPGGHAADSAKQVVFDKIAKVIKCRKLKGLPVGDGVGTAAPIPPPTDEQLKNPGFKSSWDMAQKAQKKAEDDYAALTTDADRKKWCDRNWHFFMQYYDFATNENGEVVRGPHPGSPCIETPVWGRNVPTVTEPPQSDTSKAKAGDTDGGGYLWDYSKKCWVKTRFPAVEKP